MVCRVVAVLLVIALLPREGSAQSATEEKPPAGIQVNTAEPRKSRRAMWIGLGAGFGGGMVFGEYYFGRHLDMPHGPDMLMGGMIGAGAGALIAWLATRNGPTPSTAVVRPLITPHTKALTVSFPLGRRTRGGAAKSP